MIADAVMVRGQFRWCVIFCSVKPESNEFSLKSQNEFMPPWFFSRPAPSSRRVNLPHIGRGQLYEDSLDTSEKAKTGPGYSNTSSSVEVLPPKQNLEIERKADYYLEAKAVHADVSREDQVKAMFRKMFVAYGSIDNLVNNAGLQQDAAFQDMTLTQWTVVLSVNRTGQILYAGAAGRHASILRV